MITVHARRLTASTISLVGGPEIRDWHEAHRHFVPGHEHTWRFKNKTWDGTWAPGTCRPSPGGTWCWTGSRGLVALWQQQFSLVPSPVQEAWAANAATAFLAQVTRRDMLRDYQVEAFVSALQHEWGRVALATNAGKGAIIALLLAFARAQEMPSLVLCDEISVLDALREEIQAWGQVTPQEVRAGHAAHGPPDVGPVPTLAMVPTLSRRLKTTRHSSNEERARARAWAGWVAEHRMVLCDEADKATAPTWQAILRAAVGSTFRLGFSGTFPQEPYPDLILTELLGPIIARVRNDDLIARGVSATPQVIIHGFDASAALHDRPHSFVWWRRMSGPERRTWVYDRAIVYNQARHAFIASLVQPQTPTAIVVNRIEHGEMLAASIPGAVFLDGSASEAERRETLDAFRDGRIHVVVVTKILDRGSNRLGHAADLIFASGEGSTRQTLQRIGRGLRRTGGKEFLRLVDIVDRGDKALMYSKRREAMGEEHEGFLTPAARKRLDVYRAEGFDVEIAR